MTMLNIRLNPTPEAAKASIMPPSTIRFYESSQAGMVSVVMYSEDTTYVQAGTRLTKSQIIDLADALNEYLHADFLADLELSMDSA